MRCRMNFEADPVQTQTPQFMEMDSQRSTNWMKAVASVTPLPESEGLNIVPIGARLIMFLVKRQQ